MTKPLLKEPDLPITALQYKPAIPHLHAIACADISSPLENKINRIVKRAFDLLVSSILILLVLSWMIPLIALVIKMNSRGPVFFLQKRHKKNGMLFTCIKFRTMIVNDEADIIAAYENDRRITKPGIFLRRHHLDELPQLFNVWKGDISLSGPRPYMISDDLKYRNIIPQYSLRYKVKPGMTGLAQSLGHYGFLHNADIMKERIRLDLFYIQNWSLKMEAQILYRTLLQVTGLKSMHI